MANPTTGFGLRHVKARVPGAVAVELAVASNYGTAIGIGSVVEHTGTSNQCQVYTVSPGNTGAYGVVIACRSSAGLPLNHIPASTGGYVSVYLIDEHVFLAREDSVTSSLDASAAGANIQLIAGTISTETGESGWLLDSNTVNTTATLPIRIIALAEASIDNDDTAANKLVYVTGNYRQAAV